MANVIMVSEVNPSTTIGGRIPEHKHHRQVSIHLAIRSAIKRNLFSNNTEVIMIVRAYLTFLPHGTTDSQYW